MLADYAYDLTGNLALALGCFAATASLVQMFQIGRLRRRVDALQVEKQAEEKTVEVDNCTD